MKEFYQKIDTPQLLVNMDQVKANIKNMQEYCNRAHVKLRPHTKTHKSPYFAKIQEEFGSNGITVAKVGEAEVMSENGLRNIFIAYETVGDTKLERIKRLIETGKVDFICFGVDSPCQIKAADRVFSSADRPAEVSIEIDVGEKRSGVFDDMHFIELVETIKTCQHVHLHGIFCCEGHTYDAISIDMCHENFDEAQRTMLHYKKLAEDHGLSCETVSMGSTPAQINQFPIFEGITEVRPGTYIFMDMWQANALHTQQQCAASILATVISKPTSERVVIDVGDKGLSKQFRNNGICQAIGVGKVKGWDNVYVTEVYCEHGIIHSEELSKTVQIGDKIEIIPSHICPVVNLYESMVLVSGEKIIGEVPVMCRGKMK